MLSYLHKHVKNLFVIDARKACEDIGSSKVLNILLLGTAIQSGALGLSETDIRDAIKKRLPEKFHELNFKALEYARSHSESI